MCKDDLKGEGLKQKVGYSHGYFEANGCHAGKKLSPFKQ